VDVIDEASGIRGRSLLELMRKHRGFLPGSNSIVRPGVPSHSRLLPLPEVRAVPALARECRRKGRPVSELTIEFVVRDRTGAVAAIVTSDGVIDAEFASAQIARGEAHYVAGPDSYVRARVRSIPALGGPYLYVNWDGTRRNNLHDLARGLKRIDVRSVARRESSRRALWFSRFLLRARAYLAAQPTVRGAAGLE
jgi:hypothetical protein